MPSTTAGPDRTKGRSLLTSPPLSEAVDRACLERVTGGAPPERNVVIVSYHRPATVVVDDLRARLDEPPRDLGVVDARDDMRSASASAEGDPDQGIANVAVSLSDPGDVDAVVEVVGRFLGDWTGDATSVAYVDSLTGMIHRTGLEATVAFVDAMGELLSPADRAGYFRLDHTAHDALTLAMLDPRFDSFHELGTDGDWRDLLSASDGLDADGAPGGVSADRAFDILASPRRRLLLHGLRLAGGRAPLSELAAFVARREAGTGAEPTDEAVSRVLAGLWHAHLPKLDDRGVVSYDEATDAVELVAPRRVEPFLSVTAGEDLDE